jgi:hypothetical protein
MSAKADPKATPRSAVDRWNAAVREAHIESPAGVLAMTDEEIALELEAAGISRAEVDAKADAFLATLQKRQPAETEPEPVHEDGAWVRPTEIATKGPKRSRAAYIAIGVAAAAAVGGAAYLATRPAPEEPKPEEPLPPKTVTPAPTVAPPSPAPTHAPPPSDKRGKAP